MSVLYVQFTHGWKAECGSWLSGVFARENGSAHNWMGRWDVYRGLAAVIAYAGQDTGLQVVFWAATMIISV